VPPEPPPLEGYTFERFRYGDGTVGTKNLLGISTSVRCVAGTVEFAVKRIREQLLPRYPSADDVVALNHTNGRGVAINDSGQIVARDQLGTDFYVRQWNAESGEVRGAGARGAVRMR